MDAIIETFHIDWKIIIAQAVNFGVVFLVLYLFALKPLKKIMEERSGKIAKGLSDAKENADMLLRAKADYEAAVLKGNQEAQKFAEEGKREAMREREKMMDNTKVEIENMILSGKKSLEQEKAKMVNEAKKEIVELGMAIAQKIAGTDARFDEKAVRELSNLVK